MIRRASALAFVLTLAGCPAPVETRGCLTNAECATPTVCLAGRCVTVAADTGTTSDAGSDAGTDAALDAFVSSEDASTVDAFAASDTGVDASSACPAQPSIGLFVWNDNAIDTGPAILDLAALHGVTEIYLHANLFFTGSRTQAELAAWITAANARCIDVALLYGNASWILPANQVEIRHRVDWSVAFATAHPAARPSGVHFDLEPQQLDEWDDTPMRPALITDLASIYEIVTPIAEAGGLPLTADIGFFLDGVTVTRGPATRGGHEWIIDAVSRVVIMDYRDTAVSAGHGGMIDLADTEIRYAATTTPPTPVVIAAETNAQSPTYVTFMEEGNAAMVRELGLVRTAFESLSSFDGVAIHDRDGLAALAP